MAESRATDRALDLDDVLQEIAQETDIEAAFEPESSGKCCDEPVMVPKPMILKVLKEIENDEALTPDFRAISKECQAKVDDLQPALAFLSDCVAKKSKFHSAAKEASWGNFHHAVINKTSQLQAITGSLPFSSWLCLKVFICFLNQLFQTSPTYTAPRKEHNSCDDDIVIYIGGSVIAKLKKAAYRLTDEEKTANMDILNHLIDLQADTDTDSLTDILDRGGLIRLLPQIQAMFIEMECVFLEIFSNPQNIKLSVEQYVKECMERDAILCSYYETTYASIANDTMKLQNFKSILALYFRIRAHHKCRSFMDKYLQKKQLAKKQKPLRENLKEKGKKQKEIVNV